MHRFNDHYIGVRVKVSIRERSSLENGPLLCFWVRTFSFYFQCDSPHLTVLALKAAAAGLL